MRPSKNVLLLQAFATELKARRHQIGATQEEIAGRCDLDRPYVTLIEAAQKQPSLSVIHRLAGALELSMGAFLGHVEERYAAMIDKKQDVDS